nr:solute carrier family 25 member 48 [Loxodonta africana]
MCAITGTGWLFGLTDAEAQQWSRERKTGKRVKEIHLVAPASLGLGCTAFAQAARCAFKVHWECDVRVLQALGEEALRRVHFHHAPWRARRLLLGVPRRGASSWVVFPACSGSLTLKTSQGFDPSFRFAPKLEPIELDPTRLQAGGGLWNTLSCIRMVYKKGRRVFGFFKGMSFPLASIAVYNSVVFGVFSNTQRFLSQRRCRELEASPSHTLSDLLLASMVAGVVSVGLGGPVDLIKIRLQMQTQPFREANQHLKPRAVALGGQPAYHGPVHCMATIVRSEGLPGLYRGASAMLLRDVPGYCLYFIPYVFLNEWITPEACAGPSPCAVWLAGGMAGAISWGTATPMDVVKSRLQADGVYFSKYKGVLDCISQSYREEGLKVFFRGITVNAVRGFPMSAAMFLGYELSLQAIRGDHTVTDP